MQLKLTSASIILALAAVASPASASTVPVTFKDIASWADADVKPVLEVMSGVCEGTRMHHFGELCDELHSLKPEDFKSWVESRFTPNLIIDDNGKKDFSGTATSYYSSVVNVSRTKVGKYKYPIYPRVDTTLPRGQIDKHPEKLGVEPIFYADSLMDVYVLHVQGSGIGKLEDGTEVSILFDGKNTGYKNTSVALDLVKRGIFKSREDLTLEKVQNYVKSLSEKEQYKLLSMNESYVFFKEGDAATMPNGSMGLPLTPMYSIATDKKVVDTGNLVFLTTPYPKGYFANLTVTMDVGASIISRDGTGRFDIYAGVGEDAKIFAGNMNSPEAIAWVLVPKTGDAE